MSASTLCELGRLHLTRPTADAPAVVVAAWYERKAVLLEHLAREGTGDAARLAVEAHQHAALLLAGKGVAA